jgi:ABC-2 type transport system permease protein
MYARALTWWTILRICIEERLAYRVDFWLGTLLRFLPIVTQIFLWSAVIAGVTASRSGAGGATIAGFSYPDMVAYFLLTMISRAFSSMPNLASGIALQIRNGEIKKYLVQPVDLVGFLLLMRVAHKLVYYGVALVPFAVVFYLCRGYFPGWPPPDAMLAYATSLVLAFLLGYFLEASIGMIGFWFLEVSSLLFVYMLLNFFLSGQMFPLDFLPAPWDAAIKMIPLQYLAYFPAAVFLQKITGPALWWGLAIQAGWVLFFIVASRVIYARGVRHYSGFGG